MIECLRNKLNCLDSPSFVQVIGYDNISPKYVLKGVPILLIFLDERNNGIKMPQVKYICVLPEHWKCLSVRLFEIVGSLSRK